MTRLDATSHNLPQYNKNITIKLQQQNPCFYKIKYGNMYSRALEGLATLLHVES